MGVVYTSPNTLVVIPIMPSSNSVTAGEEGEDRVDRELDSHRVRVEQGQEGFFPSSRQLLPTPDHSSSSKGCLEPAVAMEEEEALMSVVVLVLAWAWVCNREGVPLEREVGSLVRAVQEEFRGSREEDCRAWGMAV